MLNITKLIDQELIDKKQNAIYDYKFQTTMRDAPWFDWMDKPGYFEVKDEYIQEIHSWIMSTKNNSIKQYSIYVPCFRTKKSICRRIWYRIY